ncbi:dephospho-CoA kinase [Beutenbergia cavernae DSM 12333]|uniref:Dephospho-CoA kinase n=1 Tax=Beutenbergia cavernae (strain ATCC BAA-8 / DSM 12333 / CCUG 43141 / JCM 11478 / NBRC 16432 / NCIMB 13614 / HKI 0122) TaxID=471853 RepID=C5BV52_BEUC1|nr:dephospho-CoA kinase [Beutenbergia cavernae]ACQ80439.1 dephospho-CoA kinase [Beutenbergia cavernae DSM 12333]
MLLVGLTGGIASGKSTVAREMSRLGALVVDADVLAREVVEPGTPGLASVVAEFGDGVLAGDGSLDRSALAQLVFADDGARRRLEAIVHPAVGERFARFVEQAPRDAVVVHDVPLLVENGLGDRYHLVVVVDVPAHERERRLVTERGLTADEARARIAAQADDGARRAAADVLLGNDRPLADTLDAVRRLWRDRVLPFEENVRESRPAERGPAAVVDPPAGDPWAAQAGRILARLRRAGGSSVVDAEHIGSTAVPGLAATDVLDLQLGVETLEDADALAGSLARAGFPPVPGRSQDTSTPDDPDPAQGGERLHANADPGRAVDVHVRVAGSPGWRDALSRRDSMRDGVDGRAVRS